MNQAISVLLSRVNGTGNSGAQVQQSGADLINVTIPGQPPENVLKLVSTTAKMAFRPVYLVQPYTGAATPNPVARPSSTATPSTSASPKASTNAQSERGLWLTGTVVTTPVTDWSFVTQYPTDQIQTNTWYFIPHSVNTGHLLYNGQLYITSAFGAGVPYPQGKNWVSNVYRDPHVRLKFGNQLFDRTLVPVTDPAQHTALLQALADRNHQAPTSNGSSMHFFHVVPD